MGIPPNHCQNRCPFEKTVYHCKSGGVHPITFIDIDMAPLWPWVAPDPETVSVTPVKLQLQGLKIAYLSHGSGSPHSRRMAVNMAQWDMLRDLISSTQVFRKCSCNANS